MLCYCSYAVFFFPPSFCLKKSVCFSSSCLLQVIVSHSMATGLTRTINLEVYLNYDDEGGAPTSGDSTAMQCAQDLPCPEATDCAGDSAEVKASGVVSDQCRCPLEDGLCILDVVSVGGGARCIHIGMGTSERFFCFGHVSVPALHPRRVAFRRLSIRDVAQCPPPVSVIVAIAPHAHETKRNESDRIGSNRIENKTQVLTFDGIGDGWSDPFGEATEFWNLVGATGSWSGNLMKGHEGARSTLCLADGDYDFSAPGAVSWVSERASGGESRPWLLVLEGTRGWGWLLCLTSTYCLVAVGLKGSRGGWLASPGSAFCVSSRWMVHAFYSYRRSCRVT